MVTNSDAAELQSKPPLNKITTDQLIDFLLQIILSCANEEANPAVSREYHLLRRLIDNDENFIEVTALGEDLAMNVIK